MIRSTRLAAAVAASAVLVAACSPGSESAPTTSLAATTTTAPRPVQTDGRLSIGILLPTSDSVIGDPMLAAVEEAIDRINDEGGVLGATVRTFVVDEGATTASASSSIQTLLARDVDAIVGPASSLLALGTLDEIVSSGTLACSPTASALALDDFPDDDLFFRTMPSDSLQARAIAEAAAQTGSLTVNIVHVDDSYGRAFAEAVEASMLVLGISVAETVTFSGRDDNLTAEARQLLDSDAPVTIILANGEDATRFIATLDDSDTSGINTVLVNDAVRNPSNPQLIAGLDNALRSKIVGIAPQAESSDPAVPYDPPGIFATYAYDCVNLIALAAVQAGTDEPRAIATEMADVSAGGSACGSFADCVAAIGAGLQVDYNGPSGLTELSARQGDPDRAFFDRFVFAPDGEDELQQTVVVGG